VALYQLKQIVEEPDNKQEQDQFQKLEESYSRWFYTLQQDPKCMDACQYFYDAIGENHDLLKARDETLLTADGDLFSRVFDKEGLDTELLYNMLGDGSDGEEDAKSNVWTAFTGLYQLAVLICIYLKMPLVKEIIDMILINNPDLNQKNIFEKIFKEFKGKRRLRKLIMKLLKSKEDNFGDIFTSLQRVIATFSSEVNMDKGMKANLNVAKDKIAKVFDSIVQKAGIDDLKMEERDTLLKAIEDGDEAVIAKLISDDFITKEQVEEVKRDFIAQGLDKMNVTKVVRDLGGTMEKMMTAINSGSEEEMQKILEESGSGLNIGGMNMDQLKGEMAGFEEEFEGDSDDEGDSGDDEREEDRGELSRCMSDLKTN
jgi:hypothetical protein